MIKLFAIQVVFPEVEYATEHTPYEVLFTHAENKEQAIRNILKSNLCTFLPWTTKKTKVECKIRTIVVVDEHSLGSHPRYIAPTLSSGEALSSGEEAGLSKSRPRTGLQKKRRNRNRRAPV